MPPLTSVGQHCRSTCTRKSRGQYGLGKGFPGFGMHFLGVYMIIEIPPSISPLICILSDGFGRRMRLDMEVQDKSRIEEQAQTG